MNYMNTKSRLLTAIATGAVLLNALAPLASADTVTLTGNGAFSNSTANLSNNSTTVVSQTNSANISNNVNTSSNTGNNSASFNTGGQTAIVTGNATSDVNVSTAANLNRATVDPSCGCNNGNTTVNISGNGAYANSTANVDNSNAVVLSQDNVANVDNNIRTKQNTGNNDAGFNTGGATVISTGNANSNVTVSTAANANVAQVGGGLGLGTGNGSSVTLTGNGAFSDNNANLTNGSAVVLSQTNEAYVDNNIRTKQDTGNNSADFNTGGTTFVKTGDANANTTVNNLVNFNAADVDPCGCIIGGDTLKAGGNGAFSDNTLNVDNSNDLVVANANLADLLNNVNNKAKTGNNDISFSTGNVMGDPTVVTGDSNSSTDVMNNGNVNLFNQGTSLTLPGGLNLGLSFDLNGLLNWLMI